MTRTVELPVWLLVLVLGFAGIAALDRVLAPSVRWFLRRRMERLVARLKQLMTNWPGHMVTAAQLAAAE